MKKTRICCLEDSPSVLHVHDYLVDVRRFEIKATDDYRDLAEWIVNDPDYYDVFILDLRIPAYSLRAIPILKNYNEEIHFSPTLYFINMFLLPMFPQYAEKIVILSAYLAEYQNKKCGDQLERFKLVDKNDQKCIEKLDSYIDLILEKKNENEAKLYE